MRALAGFVRFAEAVNDVVGRTVAYFTLATVLICATVVIIRYVFETGFIWLQELYVWTHAAAFMLGAGFTLMVNRHVRVDILYATRSERTRAWLDLLAVRRLLVGIGGRVAPSRRNAGAVPLEIRHSRLLCSDGPAGIGHLRAQPARDRWPAGSSASAQIRRMIQSTTSSPAT